MHILSVALPNFIVGSVYLWNYVLGNWDRTSFGITPTSLDVSTANRFPFHLIFLHAERCAALTATLRGCIFRDLNMVAASPTLKAENMKNIFKLNKIKL